MGGVPDQCVLEAVGRVGWNPAPGQEFAADQFGEARVELVLGQAGDRRQQVVVEFAPEAGGSLGDGPHRR